MPNGNVKEIHDVLYVPSIEKILLGVIANRNINIEFDLGTLFEQRQVKKPK